MSGSWVDANSDSVAQAAAATAASYDAVMARVERRQAEAHTFLEEWGAEVIGGHEAQVIVPPFLEG